MAGIFCRVLGSGCGLVGRLVSSMRGFLGCLLGGMGRIFCGILGRSGSLVDIGSDALRVGEGRTE